MLEMNTDFAIPSTPAQFAVDKGIPVPPTKAKYPWRTMEIGDSFLVTDKAKAASVRVATYKERVDGRRFLARPTSEGMRIWRTV